jgi:amino acid transporter
MSGRRESLILADPEKRARSVAPVEPASLGAHLRGRQFSVDITDVAIVEADQNKLHRRLKGRHMQMIAM